MSAADLLVDSSEVRDALGPEVTVEPGREHRAMTAIGGVVAAAASDAAYRSFGGYLVLAGARRPIAVGEMALVFDTPITAEQTFDHVASAAHLRTRVGDCNVAVETVTAPSGLVSYWGYLQRQDSIVVLTLDTLDPLTISMTTFRSLVTLGVSRLEHE